MGVRLGTLGSDSPTATAPKLFPEKTVAELLAQKPPLVPSEKKFSPPNLKTKCPATTEKRKEASAKK